MKLWWHKLTRWEYWPASVIYTPTAFLWAMCLLRFMRLHFYRHANPAIQNGGLFGDSKADIYKLLPDGTYPKTLLVTAARETDLAALLAENSLRYPVIAKPDIGCRGVAVQKIFSLGELLAYHRAANRDYLIQEVIEYPNEIGLFYCRFPSEQRGTITGLTMKKFLTVTGDGKQTLEQLLQQKPRFEMQIPKLRDTLDLSEVLKNGETRTLVPYGNHNRGTEFLDGHAHITPKLQSTFDNILRNINGFYYGRLDIRYNTLEELEDGKNFSIIELNGAKSEPTHIYDPRHSFWHGQREIFRHQRIFQRIIHEVIQSKAPPKRNEKQTHVSPLVA